MKIIDSIGISRAKHYDWKVRYGLANEHNAKIRRDYWLEEEEKIAIVKFYLENKEEGYKRLTYMLMDAAARELRKLKRSKSWQNNPKSSSSLSSSSLSSSSLSSSSFLNDELKGGSFL